MENSHILGLYVSYYLSRFNKQAYQNLGIGNQAETHAKIGELMNINRHTVKNWRDEFDPIHGHRAGWYQRAMIPSRLSIVEALQDLDEPDIRAIVLDILYNKFRGQEDQKAMLIAVSCNEKKTAVFIPRGITGKKAEEFFIHYHQKNGLPIKGLLTDTRDNGCGYDFEITKNNKSFFVEVKGLADDNGGIQFTSKEWNTASKYGDSYYLAIVKNLDDSPKISFIRNPFSLLKAQKSVYTSVQVKWAVTQKELNRRS